MRNSTTSEGSRRLMISALLAVLFLGSSCSDKPAGESTARENDASGTSVVAGVEGSTSGRGSSPAVGAPMTFQQPRITDIQEIFSLTNAVGLETRPVQLTNIKVQRVLSQQYALVGPNTNQMLVVRFQAAHPELKVGQTLNVSGMISQIGEDLAQWDLDPENKALIRPYSIFLNAMNEQVNP